MKKYKIDSLLTEPEKINIIIALCVYFGVTYYFQIEKEEVENLKDNREYYFRLIDYVSNFFYDESKKKLQ